MGRCCSNSKAHSSSRPWTFPEMDHRVLFVEYLSAHERWILFYTALQLWQAWQRLQICEIGTRWVIRDGNGKGWRRICGAVGHKINDSPDSEGTVFQEWWWWWCRVIISTAQCSGGAVVKRTRRSWGEGHWNYFSCCINISRDVNGADVAGPYFMRSSWVSNPNWKANLVLRYWLGIQRIATIANTLQRVLSK